MAQANALYGEGKLEEADKVCEELLKAAPDFGEALNLKGIIAFRQGSGDIAIKWLSKATEIPDAQPNFFNNLGEVLRQGGALEQAEGVLRQAIAMNSAYAVAINNLGITLIDRGKPDDAVPVLRQAIKQDERYADAHNNLATAYLAKGEPETAEEYVRLAITLGPVKPEFHHNLGLALEGQGDDDGALEAYQQALSLNFADEKSFENLCAILFEQDDPSSVRDLCLQLRNMDPALAYPYFHGAKAAILLGDKAVVEEELQLYLERAPEDALGASLLLGSQGAGPVPTQAGEAFLKNFYRHRAQNWDQFVTSNYHGHEIVLERLTTEFEWPRPINRLLDLGCGTGALGAVLRPQVKVLDGIDISPEMVRRAETKMIYDDLILGDAVAFLQSARAPYEMIIAAAMLFHFRDLDEIFSAVAAALEPNGGFVFTVFKTENPEPELNAYNLYLHSRAYLQRTLAAAGFGGIVISEHIHEYERKTTPRYCYAVSCRKS